MARLLRLSKADVETPDGLYRGVGLIQEDDGTVHLTRRGQALVTKPASLPVERDGTRNATVEFEDGEAWQVVVKKAGCGCGGGR